MESKKMFELRFVPSKIDQIAPDGSEIRLLPAMTGGGLCHCTLPPGKTSLTGVHTTVEEIWYFIQGRGLVWRKQGSREEEVDVFSHVCLTIPPQTHFQFRNTGWEPLCFIISTMPPWPGQKEWSRVPDHWSLDQ